MTEDIQVPTSMSEYNRNVPSEKPQLQVIDIIDQISNSVELFPFETAEPSSGSLLTQENQEGTNNLVENTAYEVSVGMKDHGGKPEGNKEEKADISSQKTRDWEEESGEGLCGGSHPVSTQEHEATKQEEWDVQQPQDEMVCSTNEAMEDQREVQLSEPKEHIKEKTQLGANEYPTEEDSHGTEEGMQKENNEDSHKPRQEGHSSSSSSSKDFFPSSPSCNSQTEKPDEQAGSMKKNDISRHSYSRYNTISYRKIRKGNTKQRIDEFESMMHS